MLFLGALCPSKSGLMNKHIVKHIQNKHIVKHIETFRETFRGSNISWKHIVGLTGLMPYLGCPIPVLVRTNKQTYRETYRGTSLGAKLEHQAMVETYRGSVQTSNLFRACTLNKFQASSNQRVNIAVLVIKNVNSESYYQWTNEQTYRETYQLGAEATLQVWSHRNHWKFKTVSTE